MWGEPERALALDASDPLSILLFQVTGPAHIPWQDAKWQDLLCGYGVWVHVVYEADAGMNEPDIQQQTEDETSSVLQLCCRSLRTHAARTSNLACLCLYVARMLRELSTLESSTHQHASAAAETPHPQQEPSSTSVPSTEDAVATFSNRISLVGKARAMAGALTLLRILIHAMLVVVVEDGDETEASATNSRYPVPPSDNNHNNGQKTNEAWLRQVFTYQSRDSSPNYYYRDATSTPYYSEGETTDAGAELLHALLDFLVVQSSSLAPDPSLATPPAAMRSESTVPELYDAVTLAFQLLLVLLSSQLYRPMVSSWQLQEANSSQQSPTATLMRSYFWDALLLQARQQHDDSVQWSPRSLLTACLECQVQRPVAPPRSIAQHTYELARSVAQAKGELVAPDGMYQSHLVVLAEAPLKGTRSEDGGHGTAAESSTAMMARSSSTALTQHGKHGVLDVTKGVLVLSSSIILLPFRLMSLALSLWGHRGDRKFDQVHKKQMQSYRQHAATRRTRDVLWLTDSPIADLASCLLLLLTNNDRVSQDNPFRTELEALVDNRWESDAIGLPDLPDPFATTQEAANESTPFLTEDGLATASPPPRPNNALGNNNDKPGSDVLTINFEALFEAFGRTCHSEVGALSLYTLLQASPAFADAMAVRSDLDTLVLPLLRTLYFSSSLRQYAAYDYTSRRHSDTDAGSAKPLDIRSCPFRSLSQLYVIIILLLLFSQDSSFGTDAFRRVMVSTIPWYKERNLTDISLGSVLLLVLLRSLMFNLSRLHDVFFLSNCGAVLMNLAPSIVDLHDYAAMRLASVTVSTMKRYATLRQEHPDDTEEDLTTPVAMHGEVVHTLLGVLKHCLSAKNIERNLHLVYALVYHQGDFRKVMAMKGCPFKKKEVARLETVIATASNILELEGGTRTASKALRVLSDNKEQIRDAIIESTPTSKRSQEQEDFTFSYEEEADPEIFFVPYVWDVIVCVATSSSIEWDKNRIQVFPLLDDIRHDDFAATNPDEDVGTPNVQEFSQDVSDVV